jgi:hypothetical protein
MIFTLVRAAFFIILFTVFTMISPAAAEIYRNVYFGFKIVLPSDIITCLEDEDIYNHGLVILLDAKKTNDCESYEARKLRHISIFAFYNSSEPNNALPDLLRWVCRWGGATPCLPAPKGLSIGTLTSLAVKRLNSSGEINITVLAQGGGPEPLGIVRHNEAHVHAVNYLVTLKSDRAHFKDDMRYMREILKDIRFILRGY